MKQSTCNRLGAGLLALGLALAVPAYAQMGGGTGGGGMMGGGQGMDPGAQQKGGGMMNGQQGMGGPGAREMSSTMHDMADQMTGMSNFMNYSKLTAADRKRMAERMRQMAGMMDRMSRMAAQGMMMDEGMQKQMQEMRQQMNEMMKSPVMKEKRP